MRSRSTRFVVPAALLVAALSLALRAPSAGAPPADAALPPDVKPGVELHGVITARPMPAVLQAYTGGPIEVKQVRGTWISVDYTGSLEKQTWLDFSKVIAYRTER